jgi:hypothetical protein
MRVLAFTGGSHAKLPGHRKRLEALAPDAVFDKMTLLPELIKTMGGNGSGQHA